MLGITDAKLKEKCFVIIHRALLRRSKDMQVQLYCTLVPLHYIVYTAEEIRLPSTYYLQGCHTSCRCQSRTPNSRASTGHSHHITHQPNWLLSLLTQHMFAENLTANTQSQC